jgi:hypothetical protein
MFSEFFKAGYYETLKKLSEVETYPPSTDSSNKLKNPRKETETMAGAAITPAPTVTAQ